MRTSVRTVLFMSAICALGLNSCKKDDDPAKGFSAKVRAIISQDEIDGLRARGMIVNEGTQPPNIEGIFVSSPHELVSPYGPDDDSQIGESFNDLIIRFSNQNSSDQSAKVDTKSGSTVGAGVGGFLAGNGNKFTFFAEINSQTGSATSKQVRLFSGEITDTGIKDFYTTLLMKSKTDPDDELIPVGSSRIIKDGDAMASRRNTFRIGADKVRPTKEESAN
ncbi:hypothetical protein GCM10027341_47700 [Spirosoma knui]